MKTNTDPPPEKEAAPAQTGAGQCTTNNPSISRESCTSNVFERGLHLAIAALTLERYKPSAHEWVIIRKSAASPRVRSSQLELLLIEACAPSRECSDPAWFWALSRETNVAAIIAARLDGYLPPELIDGAAKAAAAVVFGATITIQRRPAVEAKAREVEAIADLLREGMKHAA